MRKSIQRIIGLILTVICCISILAGCDNSNNPPNNLDTQPTNKDNSFIDSIFQPNDVQKLSIEDIRKYIGKYETENEDASFEIYGVSDIGEIYFQADWYRANGFGGVATIKDNQAVFSISCDGSIATGNFSFDNNKISLTLAETNIYCLEKGQYSYLACGEVYKETTWCGMGELNHDAFLRYLNDYLIDDGEWEYCGQPGEVFQKPDGEYAEVFDLYLLKSNGNNTYYTVTLAADYKSHEVYWVGSDGKLELVCLLEPEITHNIPKVSLTSTVLDTDWEILKIRLGNNLGGTGFNGTATVTLYLHNIDYIDCYHLSSYPAGELLGVQNGEVAFYGAYGTSSTSYVRDFVPNDALKVAPATYPIDGGKITAYVWELENGFLAVYGMTISSFNWYDQPAFGYVQVRDLEYLSFIQ